jgi:hypothetical protein
MIFWQVLCNLLPIKLLSITLYSRVPNIVPESLTLFLRLAKEIFLIFVSSFNSIDKGYGVQLSTQFTVSVRLSGTPPELKVLPKGHAEVLSNCTQHY